MRSRRREVPRETTVLEKTAFSAGCHDLATQRHLERSARPRRRKMSSRTSCGKSAKHLVSAEDTCAPFLFWRFLAPSLHSSASRGPLSSCEKRHVCRPGERLTGSSALSPHSSCGGGGASEAAACEDSPSSLRPPSVCAHSKRSSTDPSKFSILAFPWDTR